MREILLLGDPQLYLPSEKVEFEELREIESLLEDLRDTVIAFREKYGFGRAITAPQIGVRKRVIYIHLPETQVVINPKLTFPGEDKVEVWDNCMSFPELSVKVERFNNCRVEFRDLAWHNISWDVVGDLSELIQHEYDHLEGILATMRAVNNRAFALKKST